MALVQQDEVHQEPGTATIAIVEGMDAHHVVVRHGRDVDGVHLVDGIIDPGDQALHLSGDVDRIGVVMHGAIRFEDVVRRALVLARMCGLAHGLSCRRSSRGGGHPTQQQGIDLFDQSLGERHFVGHHVKQQIDGFGVVLCVQEVFEGFALNGQPFREKEMCFPSRQGAALDATGVVRPVRAKPVDDGAPEFRVLGLVDIDGTPHRIRAIEQRLQSGWRCWVVVPGCGCIWHGGDG